MRTIKEEWRPVEGFEQFYEVSNLGRVRSLDRVTVRSDGKRRPFKGMIRKPVNDKNGYHIVSFCVQGVHTFHKVHRMVAKAFIPNPNNKPQTNHIDGCKFNNHIDNLEWVDNGENQRHAYSTGMKIALRGSQMASAKLNEDQVADIKRLLIKGVNIASIAQTFSVTSTTIYCIRKGETWKHVALKEYDKMKNHEQ